MYRMRQDRPSFAEQLHSLLVEGWGINTRDFAHDSVARAMAALNTAREPRARMVGQVLWLGMPIAFTAPGPYVYITRRLIERCGSDAPVAFALAHEIGHHDLGHLDRADQWMAAGMLAHTPGRLALIAIQFWSRWLYSRDNELAADAYALDLCGKAGFDQKECLKCFDIFSWYALDHNDFDGVYGQDEELELDPNEATGAIDRAYIEARLWWARHRRSHPSIHERRQILLHQLNINPRSTAKSANPLTS
jgi:predicted Zn-dependent protease